MVVPIIQAGVSFIAQSLVAEAQRERSPRAPKGQMILEQIAAVRARGLEPVLTTDPFTGGLVLSTADQAEVLAGILFERERQRVLAPTPGELDEISAFRQAFIDRFDRFGPLPDPRVAAAAPMEPVAAPVLAASTSVVARLVAPGVVVRGTAPRITSRRLKDRLSGECAGPQTGISRLRCGLGGFA
ncbi:MAG: hypothetical protein V3S55_10510 [Nitrospiraceae bacterium]